MSDSFYPNAQGDQVAWNSNIITELPGLAATVGVNATQLASILADCQMEIFLLTTVEQMADSFRATLYGYVHNVEGTPTGPIGTTPKSLPDMPVWPADAPAAVPTGIAARRSA